LPTISFFYGIAIRMFVQDHPPPHFHAIYAEWEATFSIEDCGLLEGRLPSRARRLVREWYELHRAELVVDWQRAEQGLAPERIEGLDANQSD